MSDDGPTLHVFVDAKTGRKALDDAVLRCRTAESHGTSVFDVVHFFGSASFLRGLARRIDGIECRTAQSAMYHKNSALTIRHELANLENAPKVETIVVKPYEGPINVVPKEPNS